MTDTVTRLHILITREKHGCSALCLELDVASQGRTVAEARRNLREAVVLYLESVHAAGDEKDFIPRPAPREDWLKYFKVQARILGKRLNRKPARVTYDEVVYAEA
jgi:hypothetical protein